MLATVNSVDSGSITTLGGAGLGAAGAVGQAGLPKPTATWANFWEPGGCLFRPLVQFETAPGGVGHGGVGGPTGGQMGIWPPTLTLPPQGL